VSEHHKNDIEVEFITIVEGPAPDFMPISEEWPLSLCEGAGNTVCAACKLRTFDAEALAERCRAAWREGRPVHLDYPDGEGGRLEADIVAVRTETVEQGDILHLWVCL
jgi:hypothetical protein